MASPEQRVVASWYNYRDSPQLPPEILYFWRDCCPMNRKLLVRFTIPSLVIGLSFFAACLISIRYIHRLQTNLADVLAENVVSLEAAQELEIGVRQLRFHNLLYLL